MPERTATLWQVSTLRMSASLTTVDPVAILCPQPHVLMATAAEMLPRSKAINFYGRSDAVMSRYLRKMHDNTARIN